MKDIIIDVPRTFPGGIILNGGGGGLNTCGCSSREKAGTAMGKVPGKPRNKGVIRKGVLFWRGRGVRKPPLKDLSFFSGGWWGRGGGCGGGGGGGGGGWLWGGGGGGGEGVGGWWWGWGGLSCGGGRLGGPMGGDAAEGCCPTGGGWRRSGCIKQDKTTRK